MGAEHKWEVGKTAVEVERFKNDYRSDISLTLVAQCYGMSTKTTHQVAERLGLPLREQKPRGPSKKQPPVVSSLDEVNQQIEKYNQLLQELEQKRLSLLIRAEVDGEDAVVYGCGEPIRRNRKDWFTWLKAGGPAILRACISGETA